MNAKMTQEQSATENVDENAKRFSVFNLITSN